SRLAVSATLTHVKLRSVSQAVVWPDEKWVAFIVRGNAYVVAMPRSSDPVTVDLDSSPLPVKTLTNEGAEDLRWEDGGKTLTWGFTNHYYRVARDHALSAAR